MVIAENTRKTNLKGRDVLVNFASKLVNLETFSSPTILKWCILCLTSSDMESANLDNICICSVKVVSTEIITFQHNVPKT